MQARSDGRLRTNSPTGRGPRRRPPWTGLPLRFVAGAWLVLAAAPAGADLFWRGKKEEADLVAGRAALEDGFYDLARERLEAYIEAVGDRKRKAEGTVFLARVYLGEGRYREAVSLLEERADWARRTEFEGAFDYWRARSLLALGEADAAWEVLKDFDERHEDDDAAAPALRLRAEVLIRQERLDEARAAMERYHREFPDKREAAANLLAWGRVLRRMDEPDRAVDVLEVLAEKYPNRPEAREGRLELARLYADLDRLEQAFGLLQPLADDETHPRSLRFAALQELAELHVRLHDPPVALATLAQAAALAPAPELKADAMVREAKLRLEQDDDEAAYGLLREAVVLQTDPARGAELQLFFAESLQQQGQHERAVAEFQNFLEAFADIGERWRALWGMAWSLWDLDRFAESARTFERAYEVIQDPARRAECLFKVADARLAEKQYAAAARGYLAFETTYPDHGLVERARFLRAEALARGGDIDEAREVFDSLSEGETESAVALDALEREALLLEQAGLWEQAAEVYDERIRRFPDAGGIADAIHRRGIMRYRMGQFEAALADFERITTENKDSPSVEEAAYMRGWSLYMLGRDAEALDVSQQFIARYPESPLVPRVLFWLGEFHWNRGEYETAETLFLAYAQRDPGGDLADKALFWASRSAAQYSAFPQAKEHIARLIREHPDSPLLAEARLLQANVLSKQGDIPGAVYMLEKIIKNWPTSYLVDRAWGRKGDLLYTLGAESGDGSVREEQLRHAMAAYLTVYESPTASPDLKLQALCKVGRTQERMGEAELAFETYMNVVYEYFAHLSAGDPIGSVWFTKAAFGAASLKESQGEWDAAIRIYRRVVDAGVLAAPDARKAIRRIRLENLIRF